jgi:hypothetical protein
MLRSLKCLFKGHIWLWRYSMRYDGEPMGPKVGLRCAHCFKEVMQYSGYNRPEVKTKPAP